MVTILPIKRNFDLLGVLSTFPGFRYSRRALPLQNQGKTLCLKFTFRHQIMMWKRSKYLPFTQNANIPHFTDQVPDSLHCLTFEWHVHAVIGECNSRSFYLRTITEDHQPSLNQLVRIVRDIPRHVGLDR